MESRNTELSIAFAGGGTGGHIYPGLAIISCLQKTFPCRVFWIGSSITDRKIVEEAGLKFYGIPAGKLRRNFSFKNFVDIFRVMGGFFAARKILKKERPELIFSKGGFVSVPPVIAAASLKIPVFSHESDLSPGLATKINLRYTEKLFVPYKESIVFYPPGKRDKLDVSGNPVRQEFKNADRAKGRAFLGIGAKEPVLLVLGGSTGSLEINRLIQESLPEISKYYTVVHQTGYNEEKIPDTSVKYKPFSYLRDELAHIIAAADLIICRGGAGTIWECAFLKKPMIIIPLTGKGTRGDQVENARVFESTGAAVSLHDDKTAERLSAAVAGFASGGQGIKAAAISEFIRQDASEYIAREIINRVRR